jgi:hypothetical protein
VLWRNKGEAHSGSPELVNDSGTIMSVAVGGNAVCVLKRDGSVWCAGSSESTGVWPPPTFGVWVQVDLSNIADIPE